MSRNNRNQNHGHQQSNSRQSSNSHQPSNGRQPSDGHQPSNSRQSSNSHQPSNGRQPSNGHQPSNSLQTRQPMQPPLPAGTLSPHASLTLPSSPADVGSNHNLNNSPLTYGTKEQHSPSTGVLLHHQGPNLHRLAERFQEYRVQDYLPEQQDRQGAAHGSTHHTLSNSQYLREQSPHLVQQQYPVQFHDPRYPPLQTQRSNPSLASTNTNLNSPHPQSQQQSYLARTTQQNHHHHQQQQLYPNPNELSGTMASQSSASDRVLYGDVNLHSGSYRTVQAQPQRIQPSQSDAQHRHLHSEAHELSRGAHYEHESAPSSPSPYYSTPPAARSDVHEPPYHNPYSRETPFNLPPSDGYAHRQQQQHQHTQTQTQHSYHDETYAQHVQYQQQQHQQRQQQAVYSTRSVGAPIESGSAAAYSSQDAHYNSAKGGVGAPFNASKPFLPLRWTSNDVPYQLPTPTPQEASMSSSLHNPRRYSNDQLPSPGGPHASPSGQPMGPPPRYYPSPDGGAGYDPSMGSATPPYQPQRHQHSHHEEAHAFRGDQSASGQRRLSVQVEPSYPPHRHHHPQQQPPGGSTSQVFSATSASTPNSGSVRGSHFQVHPGAAWAHAGPPSLAATAPFSAPSKTFAAVVSETMGRGAFPSTPDGLPPAQWLNQQFFERRDSMEGYHTSGRSDPSLPQLPQPRRDEGSPRAPPPNQQRAPKDHWKKIWTRRKEEVLGRLPGIIPTRVEFVASVAACDMICQQILGELMTSLRRNIGEDPDNNHEGAGPCLFWLDVPVAIIATPPKQKKKRGGRKRSKSKSNSSGGSSGKGGVDSDDQLPPPAVRASIAETASGTPTVVDLPPKRHHRQQSAHARTRSPEDGQSCTDDSSSSSGSKHEAGPADACLSDTPLTLADEERPPSTKRVGCVAINFEGDDSKLKLLTIATANIVYVIALKAAMLAPKKPLRELLEHNRLVKMMYDCRSDSHTLFRQFDGVRIATVLDLQPMATVSYSPQGEYLAALDAVFQHFTLFNDSTMAINEAARSVYDPSSGGRYEAWSDDPLHPAMLSYCAVGVQRFFIAACMMDCIAFGFFVSDHRMALMESFARRTSNKNRDFTFTNKDTYTSKTPAEVEEAAMRIAAERAMREAQQLEQFQQAQNRYHNSQGHGGGGNFQGTGGRGRGGRGAR